MTKKPRGGTLGTRGRSDKRCRPQKEANVVVKMKSLLMLNKVRFSGHARQRMVERNVIYFEIIQALNKGKHEPKRDRFNDELASWEYSIEGATVDRRLLRIGLSFEVGENGERIVVITVIDLNV